MIQVIRPFDSIEANIVTWISHCKTPPAVRQIFPTLPGDSIPGNDEKWKCDGIYVGESHKDQKVNTRIPFTDH